MPGLSSPTVTRPGAAAASNELVAVRDDFRALEGYHSAQVDVEVRLNTNESPFAPPPAWMEEYTAALHELAWHRYPDRMARDLRAAIAAGHGVDADQVFAANGSNEVLQTVLLAYAGPGRTVALFEPTYQMHAQIARVTGATVAAGQRNDDFTLDLDEVRRVITEARPSVTFLCSPNNPTGMIEPPETLDAVLELAPGLVVVDEAYAQFSTWSALDRVSDDVPLVVTRTFSKTWSMAAARLGYLIGPRWLFAQLDKVVLPYHLDAAKQLAGRLALGHVDEMERRVSQIVEERGRIGAGLADLGVEVFPSGANFVLFRLRDHDARVVWQRLVDDGVLVRDCSGWDRLDGCLRVTVGLPAENERFLAALGRALATPTTGGEA